jgi:hypothetical protein
MAFVSGEEQHYKLLRSQRAEVATAIVDAGLAINDFSWEEADSIGLSRTLVPVITHRSSDFKFIFDRTEDNFGNEYWEVRFSPGAESYWGQLSSGEWTDVRDSVTFWARLVKREESAEDPWSAEDTEEFSRAWNTTNEKFTTDQLQAIKSGLDSVESYLLEHSAKDEETTREIKAGIEDLKRSATQLGRRDWLLLFVGWFITHALDWSITSVHWHELISILLKGSRTLLIGS